MGVNRQPKEDSFRNGARCFPAGQSLHINGADGAAAVLLANVRAAMDEPLRGRSCRRQVRVSTLVEETNGSVRGSRVERQHVQWSDAAPMRFLRVA